MEKHSVFVLLICCGVFVLILSFIEYSYAQSQSSQILLPDYGVFIFVQTIVENSEGQLVTYLASDKFTDIDQQGLNSLLDADASENDPVINIEGKKFQIIQRQLNIIYDRENVISSTIMAHTQNGSLKMVARFAHDGYPILPGEKVTSIWTFIRPVK